MPELSKGGTVANDLNLASNSLMDINNPVIQSTAEPQQASTGLLMATKSTEILATDEKPFNGSTAEKAYSNRLPWGATKEKHNSIYNKNLLKNLKNVTMSFDASLTSSLTSALTSNDETTTDSSK